MLNSFEGEIPDVMVESQLDRTVEDMSYRLAMQGLEMNAYLQMQGMTMESFRKLFREQAEKQVKIGLALDQIAKDENLEVSDEELENEFKSLAEQNKLEIERVKELVPASSLKSDMMKQKAVALIKDNAKPAKKTTKRTTKKKAEDKAETAENAEEKAE